MSVVGRVLDVLRVRAGRIDLPAVAMAALLVTTILSGCLTGSDSAAPEAAPAVDDRTARLEKLLGKDSPLLENGVPTMPQDLAEVMGHVLPEGVERLPLPQPPAGEPMLAALAAYAGSQGVAAPPAEVLRPAVDALRLDAEAEQALAMLVLSYVQALDLQRKATEDLTPHEVALLERVDPTDPAALEAVLSKVDRDLMLQGADLLARAAEAAKDPLGNPPLTDEELAARRAATGAGGPAAPASTGPSPRTDWQALEALLAHVGGGGPLPAQEPAPSLAEAMAALAEAYGAPVPATLPALPASLDHAVASLVHAQALAATGDDPVQSARRLVATARDAEPTLRAWGAWLAPQAVGSSGPDAAAFLAEALAPAPGPAALVAAGRGHAPPTPIPAPALSELLAPELDAATAAAVEAALGPDVSQALAQLLAAAFHVQGAYDEAMQGLPPRQQLAMQHQDAILELLDEPSWSDEQAAAVEALALALATLSQDGGLASMQQAQEEALATVEEAVAALTDALPSLQAPASHDSDPLPHTPGTPSTDDLPGTNPQCRELPLAQSRCGDDVLFRSVVGGYLVIVTGFGKTELDPAELGEPDIHIDLGGDDRYHTAMGAARTDRSTGTILGVDPGQYLANQVTQNVVAVSVDLAGDDRYQAAGRLAQGAGSGIAALGVLWDVSGDDQYEQKTDDGASYGQGAGARSGVGVLVDSGGNDRYELVGAGFAQGVGVQGDALSSSDVTLVSPVRRAGSAGVLLDLGAGEDRFTGRGQGHSTGHGNVGLLLDQEGRTIYTATSISSSWQGGYAAAGGLVADQPAGSVGSLAALVDLGGSGDRYFGTGDLPSRVTYLPERDVPRRQDDASWVDRGYSVAVGLDSSVRDEDGDGWSSLAELLAQSDPHDPADTPTSADPEDLVSLVEELVADPQALVEDADGDGFSDAVETAAGSDPGDASSTPMEAVPLQSIADRSLCPQAEPCGPAAVGGSLTCDSEERTEPCISLLSFGAGSRDVHDHPAVVRIDLGGDDQYTHDAAGIVRIQAESPGGQTGPIKRSTGSLHLDVGGNDLYLTPKRGDTHGSAPANGTSLLLDLGGDDRYESAASSQGHGVDRGVGVLADLAGDDVYTFLTQGQGDGGRGILFDAGGVDTYRSADVERHAVSPEALASADDDAFSSQGGAESGTGLFVDAGDDQDTYWVPLPDGTPADASSAKNDVVLHRKDGGGFADGISAAGDDRDADGAPGLVEVLFSTHPGNGEDDRSVYEPGGALDEGRPLLDSTWLLGIPGLLVGGRGDSLYTEAAPFLVDLGGDDEYAAPGTAYAKRSVSFLLDVFPAGGTGDDQYLPTCATTTRDLLSCPSLGAASTGISLLADAGGTNTFRTSVSLNRTYGVGTSAVNVVAQGLSQGAGASGGVGILSTWDAVNTFGAEIVASVTQGDADTPVHVRAEGLSQGLGVGHGIGVLAGFGAGSDTYRIDVTIEAHGVTGQLAPASLGQGAATRSTLSLSAPPAPGVGLAPTVPNYGDCLPVYLGLEEEEPCSGWPGSPSVGGTGQEGSFGMLLDEGGDNAFHAPQARAQGSGKGGILWSGPGDDTYLAGPLSQASEGLLVDAGGNDLYLLRAPESHELVEDAGCSDDCVQRAVALSQGAGTAGLLVDIQGDDRHDASGWDLVQGASGGNLLDLGGSDVYLAHDRAQGHGGLLLDLTGRDLYRLDLGGQSRGQGFGTGGLLLDATGKDRYDGPGDAGAAAPVDGAPAAGGGARADGNGWTEGSGYGVDASNLDEALSALSAMTAGSVVLKVRKGSDPASAEVTAPQDGVRGTLHLFATVTGTPDNVDVDRVTFLLDNGVLGHGAPVAGAAGTYHLPWDTGEFSTVPDGLYGLVAAAFPTLQGDARVDLPASHSPEVEVGIDNVPLLTTSLSPPAFSPALDGSRSILALRLSPDLSFPDQATAGNAGGRSPGAWVEVTGAHLQTGDVVDAAPRTYLYGGNSSLDLCLEPCGDGRYGLTVTATDGSGQTASTFEFLLVDSRPPTTTVSTLAGGGYANARDRAGNNLLIQLDRDDDPLDLGPEGVSGVRKTLLVKLDDDSDDPAYTRLIENPDLTSATVPLDGESSVRLVAVSVDGVGNEESPCRKNESRYVGQVKVDGSGLCFRSADVTELTIDFNRPALFEPRVDRTHVRPGEPVGFQVRASDVGTGIRVVSVQIQDEPPVAMTDAGDGTFVFDGWDEYNKDLLDKDGEPVYAGREMEYFFTVTALDEAGNDKSIVTGGNVIDDLAPRVDALPTRYFDAGDAPLEQGRPGTDAMLVARVTDLNPNSVASMEVVGLGEVLGEEVDPIPCEPGVDSDFTLWGCRFLLVDTFPRGEHEVRVRVVDLAGNVNDAATLPLVVDAEPVTITDLHVAEVRHDGFTLEWTTSAPATSQVRYGQTPSVDRGTAETIDHVTEHSVEVRGLAPSTEYYYQAVSVSRSGVVTRAGGAADVVETANAFTVEVAGLTEGQTLQGAVDLDLEVELLAGSEAVDIQVAIQDAAGKTTPQLLEQVRATQDVSVPVETRTIPDGAYRFVLQASRGTDRSTLPSPSFWIDNTPPALSPLEPLAGAVVADATPLLRLAAVDAAGGLADVSVLVDGSPVPSTWTAEAFGAQGGIVVVTLPGDLPDGAHEVEVVATDPAGNAGSTAWDFRVDTRPPEASDARVARYEPGPLAAMPGATVHVALNATDASGVAGVAVDATPLGGKKAALSPVGADGWNGSFQVPLTASAGAHDLVLVGTDHAGNSGPVGTLRVVVDPTPPAILGADASAPNATALAVQVRVAEPASIRVVADGRAFTSTALATSHLVNVTGLRPNTLYALTVEATDGAGLSSTASASQRTGPDVGPPTAPAQLLADTTEEGVVLLSWRAAADDSGIDSYQVTRTVGGTTEALPAVPGDELVLRDVLPRPVPGEATYNVRAVDLANQTGAAVSVRASVLSLPHLANATLSPERGTTDDPFVAEVLYWSPDGRRADSVELVVGDLRLPLHPAELALDCLTPCRYAAEVSLPATGLKAVASPVFVAESGGHAAELPLGWAPVVRSGADGPAVRGDLEAPGPDAAALLFLLTAALATLRFRRRSP